MAWFRWYKKSNRKEEKNQITLHDVRNYEADVEWLLSKYKYLSKERYKHVCLLCVHIVESTDSEEEAIEEKNNFIEEIKKNPAKKREYINTKTGTHLLWINNKLIRKDTDKFDLDCFKETITQINEKTKIAQTYWAYIYKLVKDGVLGSDMCGISVDKYTEMMEGINVGKRTTLYDYTPRGTYPNYLPASKDTKKYNIEKKRIQIFVESFVETYYLTFNCQVSLEEIDSII